MLAEQADPTVDANSWRDGEPQSEDSPSYWSYYNAGTNGNDIKLTPDALRKGDNTMTLPYYAGGVIRPGYAYRIKAAIYQMTDNGYALVSRIDAKNQPDGYRTSKVVNWNSMDPENDAQRIVQTANIIRSGNSIKLDFRINDLNATSLDGKYFVRLAKKVDNGWQVLEGNQYSNYYYKDLSGTSWMNKAYDMGSSYQKVGFGLNSGYELDSDTTYRLQFYALMDPEFDNKLNISEQTDDEKVKLLSENLDSTMIQGMNDIMDLANYYPRSSHGGVTAIGNQYSSFYNKFFSGMSSYDAVPTGLTLENLGSGNEKYSLMIGCSDEITTLGKEAVASAGTYQQTTINGASQLILRFTGAFNAGSISRITYSMEYVPANTNENAQHWDIQYLEKADGTTSLFDATGSGALNTGVEGNVSLRLALGDGKDAGIMNVKGQGKYYLSMKMERYDQTTGKYVDVDSYSIIFYKTTAN